jgi:quinol monooxygenase YgiN
MIVVKVTYTVNDEYTHTNKELIQKFLTDFKKLDHTQFLYSVFQIADGKTFIHISQYKNKNIQQVLLNTPSFLYFQEQRDKNLASEPTIEFLDYVGASKEVF